MGMSLEDRQIKYQEFKQKFESMPRHLILGTLETTLSLQRNYEMLSDVGLLEWDDLSTYRGTTNALSKAAIETLSENNQIDRTLCKLWKSYHNDMWMFLDEPASIGQEIHKQFEKVFGNIALKNFGLKALSVLLSKHNWHGIPDSGSSEHKRWSDEKHQLETLSRQLRDAGLLLEVDALWDYYAPGYMGNKPTFKWLFNDELFSVIESNEDYDLYMLDQILSGEYEPSASDLESLYTESQPSDVPDPQPTQVAPKLHEYVDDYELEMIIAME